MESVLGIDIGGSGIKGNIIDIENGNILKERVRHETPKSKSVDEIVCVIKKIIEQYNWAGVVGCGFPGVVQNGIIRTATNMSDDWINYDGKTFIAKEIGRPIFLINDADAAGLAEFTLGAGRDIKGVQVMITVGTGIGTSIYYNNTLIPNTEFGHLDFKGMIAEKYASDAVRKEQNLSRLIWAKRFNEYLNYIEKLLWPELIIIGGGQSKKFDKFSNYLNVKAKIVPAKFFNNAGIIGAALATKGT